MQRDKYLVSAIVSVYNCERFLKGCLEDLEEQTISDNTEIIIVSTGSEQNEKEIIHEYQRKFENIILLETEERTSLYRAWNIGISNASGKYITNANSDDRHRKDAFEVMSGFLEKNEDVDLAYADSMITENENETFEKCSPTAFMNHSEPIDRITFSVGPHPMWRKRLHEKFGFFDESLEAAGDYEFWMRIAGRCKFKHLKEYLGLYLNNPGSAERRDYERTALEVIDVKKRYLNSAEMNRDLRKRLKKGISLKYSDLANYYFQKRKLYPMKEAALRGIQANCLNYHNYLFLLSSCFPSQLVGKWKTHFLHLLARD